MTKFFTNLKQTLAKVAKNSPIEAATCLIYFAVLQIPFIYNLSHRIIALLVLSFTISLLYIYTLNLLSKKRRRGWYYGSLILPIAAITTIVILHLIIPSFTTSSISLLCPLLLVIISKKSNNNVGFITNSIKISAKITISILLTILVGGIILSIIASLGLIFNIMFLDFKILSVFLATFIPFCILPAIFLYLEYKEEKKPLGENNFLHVIINFILTPAIVAYGVIMYLYFAKIIITQKMPEGVIFGTAITFMMIGIMTKGARLLLEKTIMNWVFKYFSLIAIPAIIMLWISVYERIANYGITTNRIYLILTLCIVTLWCVAMMFKKLYNYKYLAIVTVATFTIFIYYNETQDVEYTQESDPKIEYNYSEGYIRPDDRYKTKILDISNMNTFFDNVTSTVENGQMIIKTHHGNQIIFQIDQNDYINKLLLQGGICRGDTTHLTQYHIDSTIESQLKATYRNDSILIDITSISTTDSLTVSEFNTSWIMKKDN